MSDSDPVMAREAITILLESGAPFSTPSIRYVAAHNWRNERSAWNGDSFCRIWVCGAMDLATCSFCNARGVHPNPERAAQIAETGIPGAVFDGETASGELRAALETASHVLVSNPPDADGCPSFRTPFSPVLSGASSLQWVGYLSTTGVYGDRQGGWCFEWQTPTRPAARAPRGV